MSFVFDPGSIPPFAFGKDWMLYLGITFIVYGVTRMAYCLIRIKQLEGKISIRRLFGIK